ncbi:VPLPA-CTERM sorting domain-containing protein [Tateyamaria armeniaca]|uniref:VPLPA-CTERM sorting domain-containing protein n=1 Tax=Tateyamaria armeniaca TaxID=2518930 RepID=A0ABW8UQ17_9RHOB
MRKLFVASSAVLALLGSGALASTIDLTDGVFAVTGAPGGPGLGPTAFTETADGVTFTFSNPISRGTNQFSLGSTGVAVGGGGVSAFSFDFSVDQDVTLSSYSGYNRGAGLVDPSLSLSLGATVIDSGVAFSGTGSNASAAMVEMFSGGAMPLLTAGVTYSVSVNNPSATTLGFLTAIEFETVAAPPVPLPAGLPLLLAGLGGFAVMRRRQR